MELLADLDLREMSQFFDTFFVLPERLSRGFLAAELSSGDLCVFAFVFFLKAPNAMRFRLLKHLATHPSGASAGPPSPPLVSAEIRHLWMEPTVGRSLLTGVWWVMLRVTCRLIPHQHIHPNAPVQGEARARPPVSENREGATTRRLISDGACVYRYQRL